MVRIPDSWLVSGALGVPFDYNAVKTRVTAESFEKYMVALSAVLDASQDSHWRVRVDSVVKRHLVEVLHRNPTEDGST